MGRNRIAMNQDIFGALISHAAADGVMIQNPGMGRWLSTAGPEDQDFMSEASVDQKIFLSRSLCGTFLAHGGKKYLIISGVPEPEGCPSGFLPSIMQPGMFAVAQHALELSPCASGAQIRDVIELSYKGCPDGYCGHELGQIESLFPSLQSWTLEPNHKASSDIARAVGALLCSLNYCQLGLSKLSLAAMRNVFECGSEFIPHYNLLQGMLSINWSSLYIEIYRCLEHLYFVPRVSSLKGVLGISGGIHDISKKLERSLSWRPKESEALRTLLRNCPEEIVAGIVEAFAVTPPVDRDKLDQKASELVYDLRNDIVHFRPINEMVRKSSEEWNRLVTALCGCVIEIYEKLEGDLSSDNHGRRPWHLDYPKRQDVMSIEGRVMRGSLEMVE